MTYGFVSKSYVLDLFDCVFDCSLFDLYRRVNHEIFRSKANLSQFDDRTLFMVYNYILFNYGEAVLVLCQRISHSHAQKVLRVKKRIEHILSFGNSKFLTMTFCDDFLSRTTKLTRRRYVNRFLNSLNPNDFVANIDFGELGDREHYHAVISCDNFDFSTYTFGNLDCQVVGNTGNDEIRLSKYLNKLSLHALKESTNGCRIIYKKNSCK